jgi:hypothetical protein
VTKNSLVNRLKVLHLSGHRQAEDYTCGPSSLSLVSTAMGLGQFAELDWIPESLIKWLAVTDFRNRGMALHELALAAELQLGNKAEVLLRRAFPEHINTFRSDIAQFERNADCALILNFPQDLILNRPFLMNKAVHILLRGNR